MWIRHLVGIQQGSGLESIGIPIAMPMRGNMKVHDAKYEVFRVSLTDPNQPIPTQRESKALSVGQDGGHGNSGLGER